MRLMQSLSHRNAPNMRSRPDRHRLRHTPVGGSHQCDVTSSRQVTQQRLGLANACEGFAYRCGDEHVDAFEGLFFLPLPAKVAPHAAGVKRMARAMLQPIQSGRGQLAALAGVPSRCMVSMMLW